MPVALPQTDSNAVLHYLFPPCAESIRLRVACPRRDYSASRIARAVEDCDAHLLNLNVTSDFAGNDDTVVELRVGMRNTEALVRSLERYELRVLSICPADLDDNDTMRQRVNELLHYLEL